MSSEQERYLRWMELMWERQMSNAREERRTAEVLEALRHVAEDSGRLAVPPEYETEGAWRWP